MNEEKQLQLRNKIMRRVYILYVLRRALSPRAVKLYILGVFALELSPFLPYLSIQNIFANMPPLYNPKALFVFHTVAFMHTQLIVQISLIAVGLVLATYVYSLVRSLIDKMSHPRLTGQSVST